MLLGDSVVWRGWKRWSKLADGTPRSVVTRRQTTSSPCSDNHLDSNGHVTVENAICHTRYLSMASYSSWLLDADSHRSKRCGRPCIVKVMPGVPLAATFVHQTPAYIGTRGVCIDLA